MSSAPTIGTPFIELQRVDSTNNYATGAIHAGMAQHGTAVFAHHQTKGKGQRYKQWHGDAKKNIALSIVIKPDGLYMPDSFLLSMAAAAAVQRFLASYAGEEIKIKWPNDLYWRDRKTAGILIENVVQGASWKWSVVGIGVNVNQTDFTNVAVKAASLKQITGRELEPVALAKELCHYLQEAYDELLGSRAALIAYYRSQLYKLGETVLFRKEARLFTAMVMDVTAHGQLVVRGALEERFNVGEVEWVL